MNEINKINKIDRHSCFYCIYYYWITPICIGCELLKIKKHIIKARIKNECAHYEPLTEENNEM